MCKMDSSTDSDSEISPRWSDTSTLGCVSSAAEGRTSGRAVPLAHRSAGRHGCCSVFLDPYDGSSEDSDESRGGTSRQTRHLVKGGGGGWRRLLLHHAASLTVSETGTNGTRDSLRRRSKVQADAGEARMKCAGCRRTPEETKDVHAMDVEAPPDAARCCTPGHDASEERTPTQTLSSGCQRSLRPPCKRKEPPPPPPGPEAEPRKRQCVENMEDEEQDS
ncbi:uncharacterized protein LOC110368844 isoform X2 [Fundulus heteroclitus]|nr:uncharacterized protein LOC110368844 isoform X2 [Fundulus heteroclitus]